MTSSGAPYESAVARVEEIIRRLDSGEAGLRETLDLVKEGRELVEYCAGELEAVSRGLEELRLEELVARLERPARVSTFDLLADLPLEVEGYRLEGLRAQVSSGFERLSTVVHLHGGGAEGVGEDVVYDAEDHVASRRRARCTTWPAGMPSASSASGSTRSTCFRSRPSAEVSRLYRRWTFHSAALDLALRQAGRALHEVLGRPASPLTFVVSLRLGEPADDGPDRAPPGRATRRCASSSIRPARGRPS